MKQTHCPAITEDGPQLCPSQLAPGSSLTAHQPQGAEGSPALRGLRRGQCTLLPLDSALGQLLPWWR